MGIIPCFRVYFTRKHGIIPIKACVLNYAIPVTMETKPMLTHKKDGDLSMKSWVLNYAIPVTMETTPMLTHKRMGIYP